MPRKSRTRAADIAYVVFLLAAAVGTFIYHGFFTGYFGGFFGWAWHLVEAAGWAMFWPIYWGWEFLIWLGQ